jgi:hypothetical protein
MEAPTPSCEGREQGQVLVRTPGNDAPRADIYAGVQAGARVIRSAQENFSKIFSDVCLAGSTESTALYNDLRGK